MKRPVLRWHGGKFRLREWVISHFPPHGVYVEPFGGAASVLMVKEPAKIEVYNDANRAVVELFQVLRDPIMAAELKRRLELTPFSREEHRLAWEDSDEIIERSRRLVIRCFQSIGAKNEQEKNGWRTRTERTVWSPCSAWNGYAEALPAFTDRLRNVIIECHDWRRILEIYDAPGALFFIDPPYPFSTRVGGHRKTYGEAYELSDADHEELCRRALGLKGMAIVASYQNPIYDELLAGWRIEKTNARAQCNSPRVEVVYISPKIEHGLFSEAA